MRHTSRRTVALAIIVALTPPILTAVILESVRTLLTVVPINLLLVRLFYRATAGSREGIGSQEAVVGPPDAAESPEADAGSRRFSIALSFIIPALAVGIVARILIVPYSMYDLWFRMLAQGQSGGAVSHVFVVVAALPAAVAAGSLFRYGVIPALSATVLSILLLAALATAEIAVFLAALPVALITITSYRAGSLRFRAAAVRNRTRFPPAAILLVAAAVLAIPGLSFEGGSGSRYIDQVLSPRLRYSLLRYFPNIPMQYGFGVHGYEFDSRNLGGRPALSEQPVFRIEAAPGETIYLRTDVFDVYLGRSWRRSERMSVAAGAGDEPRLRADFRPRGADVGIEFLSDMYEAVPHTLTTRHVGFPDRPEQPRIYGHMDAGFRFELPPRVGEQIVLSRGLRESALQMRNTGEYLYVPPDTSDRVRDLASSLAAAGSRDDHKQQPTLVEADPRRILESITAHLQSGYDYTLETSPNVQIADFAEAFLFEDREGYCVHFATSFVLLARLAGIPARYATGFLVRMPERYEDELTGMPFSADLTPDELRAQMELPISRTVSGLSAHAWPEVWLPNTGWTIWEATPPMRAGEYREWTQAAAESGRELTDRQLREIGSVPDTAFDTDGDSVEPDRSAEYGAGSNARRSREGFFERLGISPATVAVAAGSTIALASILFGLIYVRKNRLPAPARARADALVADMVQSAVSFEIPPPADIGYIRWGSAIAAMLPRRRHCVERATGIVQRMLFARDTPGSRDLRLLSLLRRDLRTLRKERWRRKLRAAFFVQQG